MCNRIRMALHKPVTYFYAVFILIYLTAVPVSLKMTAEAMGVDSAEGLAGVLTIMAFWMIPANLIAYAKRKGLVYRNSDVHFLFPAPVSPKRVLVYAYLRTLFVQILLNLFIVVYGGVMFHVETWRLVVYFVFSVFVENTLEGGIMILIYGSERMGEKQRGLIVKAAYGLVGILVVLGIYRYLQDGFGMRTVSSFLHSDMVQAVPLIGWYIGVIHLLFVGPSAVNTAVSVCYALALAAVSAAAWRMKCTGAYYEDAMKFAEDYEEVLESRRQGNTQKRLGRKQKFGKASVRWRGCGGRALFYRQLLEYKKNKYFIFDINTAVALIAGAGMAYFLIRENGLREMGGFADFMIPVVSGYLIFIFTGFNGKWAKELTSPYTYLIPDTPFRKMVNAMMMQHIQSFVNACLITLPAAFAMGMPPVRALLCILFYVLLSANKLYALAVAYAVTGNTLGQTGRQLLQMFLQGMAIFAAVIGAAAGMTTMGIGAAYLFMDLSLLLFTVIFMVIAMLNFYNMETA